MKNDILFAWMTQKRSRTIVLKFEDDYFVTFAAQHLSILEAQKTCWLFRYTSYMQCHWSKMLRSGLDIKWIFFTSSSLMTACNFVMHSLSSSGKPIWLSHNWSIHGWILQGRRIFMID